jgi:hypothetical protein
VRKADHVKLRFLERKNIWWPTWQGWFTFSFIAALLFVGAFWNAEKFLSLTERVPANVLVVEGWIGKEALRSAAQEFQAGDYRWLVAVGGWPGYATNTHAFFAAIDLARMGCPTNSIIIGLPHDDSEDRTYGHARSARDVLGRHQIRVSGLMVFTRGSHARRSRVVFKKAFGPATRVGVISFCGPGDRRVPWWKSTMRSKEVMEEFLGWLRERLGPGFRDEERNRTSARAVIVTPGFCAPILAAAACDPCCFTVKQCG